MTVRAKLYYTHHNKNGDIDGEKQLASLVLSEHQRNENGFFMEVSIEDGNGKSLTALIIFQPDAFGVKTNGLIQCSGDNIFI